MLEGLEISSGVADETAFVNERAAQRPSGSWLSGPGPSPAAEGRGGHGLSRGWLVLALVMG